MVFALSMLLSAPCRADHLSDAQRVSADPDLPATGLGWRGHLQGSAGAAVPLCLQSNPGGWAVDVPALIALSNDTADPAPNNYWRGLVGLEVAYRKPFDSAGLASLALQLQHESDHETRYTTADQFAPIGYYQLNSVGVQGDLPTRVAGERITFSATARLHVITCTDTLACATANAGHGSRTVEGVAQLIWNGSLTPPVRYHPRPVVAVYADAIVHNGLVRGEQRLVLNAGAWCPTVKEGIFELFAIGWVGNEVGYLRRTVVRQVGVAIRWSP
jgi:hypothetical protein